MAYSALYQRGACFRDAYTGKCFSVVTPPQRLTDTIELSCLTEAAIVSMKLRDFMMLERFRPVASTDENVVMLRTSSSPLEKHQKVRYSVVGDVIYPDVWKREPT